LIDATDVGYEEPEIAAAIRWRFPGAVRVKNFSMKPYWRVTLWYLAFGVAWIFLSDHFVALHYGNPRMMTSLQTLKGWAFILASTLLILQVARTAFRRHAELEREKYIVFQKTIEGVHHILLNYLNQMQLVTLEAERCRDFDAATLALARELSEEASAELMKLGELETITSEQIEKFVYRKLRERN
jgi:hypothetical protein